MKMLKPRIMITAGIVSFGIMTSSVSALTPILNGECGNYHVYYKTTEDIQNRKVAYITIDDGPSKYTDEILNILKKHNAKATFFMIDRNMKANTEKVKDIVESGNSAGFHSVSHDIHKLYETSNSATKEFNQNKETFYEITGKTSNIVRLPYGSKPYTPSESYESLVESGYKLWDWDIDTQDWKSSSSQIIDSIKNQVKNKKEVVILMHEKKQTVDALDEVLSYLNSEGYEILPINEQQMPKNFWSINENKN